jgi:hypothetical protein
MKVETHFERANKSLGCASKADSTRCKLGRIGLLYLLKQKFEIRRYFSTVIDQSLTVPVLLLGMS